MHTPTSTTVSPAPERWRMPLLVKASTAVHLGAAATVVAAPGAWPWALGAVVLDLWGEVRAFDLVASRKYTLAAQTSGGGQGSDHWKT